ncbi:MlaA family lipoprotein [Ideonella sp.]|uniref:MlaA family lipoprotein n=1 Tax=Ideonella sp. TaxID=1929293 RepID=UPI003BB73A84
MKQGMRQLAVLMGATLWLLSASAAAQSQEPLASQEPSSAEQLEAEDDAATRAEALSRNAIDPYEKLNRKVFKFNEALDAKVLEPVASAYKRVLPSPVRTGVDNVLGNLGDVWSIVNHLLQGKIAGSARMTLRVASNTLLGLAGIWDPATEMGLERESEDFGQTLGRWGVPAGPYVVLPIIGPSSARDAAAAPLNLMFGPSYVAETFSGGMLITSVQVVAARAGLLSASQLLDEIALDKYSFLRDAYLSRRQNLVFDGNPPE